MIGTPTAALPPWIIKKHLDILRMDANGTRSPAGTRRNYCSNNPSYILYTKGIVERIGSDDRMVFVLNYNEDTVRIPLGGVYRYLSRGSVKGEVEIRGLDVKVFKPVN